MSKAFINSKDMLISLYTQPNHLNYEDQKFFNFNPDYQFGLKAMEVFMADIKNHLVEWAVGDNSIYYKTEKYWYIFDKNDKGYLECACFERSSGRRWDTHMNLHSCSVGKKFLKDHMEKRVPLFEIKK